MGCCSSGFSPLRLLAVSFFFFFLVVIAFLVLGTLPLFHVVQMNPPIYVHSLPTATYTGTVIVT